MTRDKISVMKQRPSVNKKPPMQKETRSIQPNYLNNRSQGGLENAEKTKHDGLKNAKNLGTKILNFKA